MSRISRGRKLLYEQPRRHARRGSRPSDPAGSHRRCRARRMTLSCEQVEAAARTRGWTARSDPPTASRVDAHLSACRALRGTRRPRAHRARAAAAAAARPCSRRGLPRRCAPVSGPMPGRPRRPGRPRALAARAGVDGGHPGAGLQRPDAARCNRPVDHAAGGAAGRRPRQVPPDATAIMAPSARPTVQHRLAERYGFHAQVPASSPEQRLRLDRRAALPHGRGHQRAYPLPARRPARVALPGAERDACRGFAPRPRAQRRRLVAR